MATQPSKDFITQLIDRYNAAKRGRSNWETQYQDVQDYVRPVSRDHQGGFTTGQRRSARIFEGTALWASNQLAAGLKSFLIPDADIWASIGVRGTPNYKLDSSGRSWVQEVNEMMHYYFSRMESNFSNAMHETFLDLVSYGTAVPFVYWNQNEDGPSYKIFDLSSVWLDQNSDDKIDVVFRDFEYTVRQARQEFGDKVFDQNEKIKKMKPEDLITITHAVFPNSDPEPDRRMKGTKKFLSVYFSEQHRYVFRMGGNELLPYPVSRWSKISGDIYGISPALIALPDILALQTMMRETMVASQLANRPPTVFDDDSFMTPIPYKPGAQIFRTPGSSDPLQLTGGNNFQITLELMQQKQEKIAKDFFIDWLLRTKKKERQTILEIQSDQEEMFRQLGAVLGRIERELLGPIVRYTYMLLDEHDKLPEPPASVSGRGISIEFVSPAANAQVNAKGNLMLQFIQEVTPLMQIDQSVAQGIKWPEFFQKLGLYRGIDPELMATPEELEAAKQQQQQMAATEQLATQGAALQPAASAMKDIATAKSQGLNVL